MRTRQLSLPSFEFKKKLSFGGLTQGRGNPKGARHVATQRAMHLILKSSKAQGEYSFLLKARKIQNLIDHQAKAQGIKVYEGANAGNHIHLIVKTPSRKALARFLRAVTGLIARKVLEAERGSPNKLQKFFDARPFTRILSWGRDYNHMKHYLMINRLELTGMSRAAIRHMLAKVDELQRSGVLAQSLHFESSG